MTLRLLSPLLPIGDVLMSGIDGGVGASGGCMSVDGNPFVGFAGKLYPMSNPPGACVAITSSCIGVLVPVLLEARVFTVDVSDGVVAILFAALAASGAVAGLLFARRFEAIDGAPLLAFTSVGFWKV